MEIKYIKRKKQLIAVIVCALMVVGAGFALADEWSDPTGTPSNSTNVDTLIRTIDPDYNGGQMVLSELVLKKDLVATDVAQLGIPRLGSTDFDDPPDGTFDDFVEGFPVGMGLLDSNVIPFATLEIFGDFGLTATTTVSADNVKANVEPFLSIASTGDNSVDYENPPSLCLDGGSDFTTCVDDYLTKKDFDADDLCEQGQERLSPIPDSGTRGNLATGEYTISGNDNSVTISSKGLYSCPASVPKDNWCVDFYIEKGVIDLGGDAGQKEEPIWSPRIVTCKQNGGNGYEIKNDEGVFKMISSDDNVNFVMTQNDSPGLADAGNVAIGATTPDERLTVEGVVSVKGIKYPDGVQKSFVNSTPSGAISFFNSSDISVSGGCPDNWTRINDGLYLVNTPDKGILDVGAGTDNPLDSLEDRPTGTHKHELIDPGHSHGYTNNADKADRHGGGNSTNDEWAYPWTWTSSTFTGITATGKAIPTGINTTVKLGTPAPYIQYVMCKKN